MVQLNESSSTNKRYTFTKYFFSIAKDRIGFDLDEDDIAYILSVCNSCEPHKKIDNKGRASEYFTLRLRGVLITIVCDSNTHKIITCVKETHHRKEFQGL